MGFYLEPQGNKCESHSGAKVSAALSAYLVQPHAIAQEARRTVPAHPIFHATGMSIVY